MDYGFNEWIDGCDKLINKLMRNAKTWKRWMENR